MSKHGVVLFHTTAAAMRAESVLVRTGLTVRLVPTPRHLSSDCGIALRFLWDDRDRLQTQLQAERVELAQMHQIADG